MSGSADLIDSSSLSEQHRAEVNIWGGTVGKGFKAYEGSAVSIAGGVIADGTGLCNFYDFIHLRCLGDDFNADYGSNVAI